MGKTVWGELRDVSGRPADFIPRLLDGMKKGRSEERRQAAEGEFWERIYGLQMVCTATAPGIDAYLELLEGGKIPLVWGLVSNLSQLLAHVSSVETKEKPA